MSENGPVFTIPAVKHPREWFSSVTRPSGPLPRPSRRAYAFDVALVLLIAVISIGYIDDHTPVRHINGIPRTIEWDEWTGAIVFLAVAMPALIWRRRFPLTVLWLVAAATVLPQHELPQLAFYLCVIAGYSAAAYSPYRIPTMLSLAAAVVAVASLTPNVLQDVPMGNKAPSTIDQTESEDVFAPQEHDMATRPQSDGASSVVPSEYVAPLILIPVVLAASAMRVWKHRVSESRTRLSTLEKERAEELRRAAEQERARIARELHDVVTHNVSVMVIQTGAARKVMDASPDQAKAALLAVEAGGRAAMSELRHVMGLLTMDDAASAGRAAGSSGDDPDALSLTPQPSLERLESLVERVRGSGTDIALTITGSARPLPSGIELAAYRVVQEALTNTVKHAAGATARITVDYQDDRLAVKVTDSGGTPTSAATTGNGHGLLGLRERLAVYGGTLRCGPTPLGGYRVEAVIPLEDRT
nr:sensor histidine kinase [Stackebrandtia nassauensis]